MAIHSRSSSLRLSGRRNPTSRARARQAPRQEYSIAPALIGGGVLGVLALILMRNRSSTPAVAATLPATTASVATTPPTTTFAPPPVSGYYQGTPQTSIGTTSGPNGRDPSPALVARLRGDMNAKYIFDIQALAYSYGVTNAIPDGIEGPVTDAMISTMTNGQYTSYSPSVFLIARGYVDGLGNQPRLLPFTLPSDVIDQLNAAAGFVDSNAHVVQVMPTVTSASAQAMMPFGQPTSRPFPAGNARPGSMSMQRPTHTAVSRPASQAVIPYAGFDRPLSVLPINAVGSQPGYGTMIDPRGLNIGLWNALEGRYHAPLGTGIVAADNDANPIAGQPGGYWSGYR